ncbi:hypothetical protein Tco_1244185 [Tanacetum coccineum]
MCVKTASTPIETHKPLVKDEEAANVDVHLYRSMIGSLMYLTASRPDIMFAVCACSRFQVTPKTSHLQAVKRIFRYLKGKPKLGLWYPRESSFDLVAYSDSDYGGANLDRKSTTGGCQFLGHRLISWQCKKQTIVATSTTEAEYVAAANCCGQVLWIQNQMLDYGFNFMNTRIFIDNESTICIVKNPVFHSKTKHIEIRHHFIRDAYEKKLIQVLKIHTDNNVADLLTKAFDVSRHQELASPKQTALGKDFSNPLIVDSLLKTIWFINAPCYCNEALAIPGKTTTGKEFSNPLMAVWQTATVETINEREQQITATVDGHKLAITEASVRRHLQLADDDGGYTLGSVKGSMKLKELTDLCTKLVDRVTSLETELKTTKEVYGKALTKLVKKVKRLEDKLKSKTRRKAKMVISDEEEDLVSEDPSKQGRMEETEYADVEEEYAEVEHDIDMSEQQVTPLKAPQVEVQSQETFKAELSALSAAKILAEASKERAKRKGTDSPQVSTASGLFGTVEDIQDIDRELARKIQEEEHTKALEQQEQERANFEAALKLQK